MAYDLQQGLASLAVSTIRIEAGSLGVVFIHKEDSRVLCHDSGTRAMVMHFRVVLMDEPTTQRPCSNRDCCRAGQAKVSEHTHPSNTSALMSFSLGLCDMCMNVSALMRELVANGLQSGL